jgi:hypothetical protein
MNTKSRPGVLSKWLMTRKFQTLPNVDDIAGYAEEWLVWWNSIQPKWRQSSGDGLLPLPLSIAEKKEDIVCLKKGGPSGLVTVLIGLKWWASIRGQDARWLASVEDIRGCMENLVAPEKKKKGGDDIGQEKKRKGGKLEGSAKRRKA